MFRRLFLSTVLLAACAGDESLSWTVKTAPGESTGDIFLVSAEIRRGGCDGEVVFADTAPADQGMPAPNALSPGAYGFAITATNGACEIIARGCDEKTLPATSVITRLERIPPEPLCGAEQCRAGRCETADAAVDAGNDGDADHSDASLDGGVDASPDAAVDAGPPQPLACGQPPDQATLAWFTFENLPAPTSTDVVASRVLTFDLGTTSSGGATGAGTDSVNGCGKGWLGNSVWAAMPHQTFEKPIAAIDLIYRTPTAVPTTHITTILSKDAAGSTRGHLLLGINPERRIVLRMQETSFDTYRCSDPIPLETWTHIGINFGAPNLELWVGGSKAEYSGQVAFLSDSLQDCSNDVHDIDLETNTYPWVFGGAATGSGAGAHDMVVYPHKDGAVIDNFVISSSRRDFSDPPHP